MERDLPMVDAYPMLCCVVSSPFLAEERSGDFVS